MASIEATDRSIPVAASVVRVRRTLDSANVSSTRSFIAGLSAGCFSTIAGYAPDTIKVRLQTQPISAAPVYTGAVQCCFRMIQTEGVSSLFKGMSTPLATRAVVNALCFSSYTYFMGAINSHHLKTTAPEIKDAIKQPHLGHVFIAGGAAGVISALIACPSELVKVQLQAGGTSASPLHHTKEILRRVGLRGMLVGMVPTMTRDLLCMGTFFSTTVLVARALAANDISTTPLTSLCAGALAGMTGWAVCYPFDVWKSNAQDFMKNKGPHQKLSFLAFFRERYQKLGVRGFYTGLAPTLFRAAPCNAAKFLAFDLALRLMSLMDK